MKIVLTGRGSFDAWRDAARDLLRHGIAPHHVDWGAGQDGGLFDAPPLPAATGPLDRSLTVPKAFLDLAEALLCHNDPGRFALAYRLLWRLQGERHLLDIASDPDVARACAMEKAVRRDAYKMTAFLRFQEVPADGPRRAFVAWFEPDHHVVARAAPFFQRRFTGMDWLIATPVGSAAWDGETLTVDDEPAQRPQAEDDTEDLWRTYFAAVFNPARLKVKMMQSEMPKKYWKNLPEAELIPGLIAGAEKRVRDMAQRAASDAAPGFHKRLSRSAAVDRNGMPVQLESNPWEAS